jgi:hypothetical protein
MRVGIVTDHGGFVLAAEAETHLRPLNKVTLLEKDLKNNSKSKGND